MFGFFEGIYAFLTRQIGLRGDVASSTGSLHAKVKDAKDSLTSQVSSRSLDSKTANAFYSARTGNTSGETVTILNITGSGYLTGVNQYIQGSSNSSGYFPGGLIITIDGITVLNDSRFSESKYNGSGVHEYIVPGVLPALLRFKTSLTIQVSRPNGNGINLYTKGTYLLD